jgi:imidazolonepropionase-like amidohydrolase
MTSQNTDSESQLFIKGGSLFDPDLGVVRPVGAIAIKGDRIVEVLPAIPALIPPVGARVI